MELIPVRPDVGRQRCPFYGFGGPLTALLDTRGNQCALMVNQHTPCAMEMDGDTPNWRACPYHSADMVDRCAEHHSQIFPAEFAPLQGSWGGIPIAAWAEYVMADTTPRPTEKA